MAIRMLTLTLIVFALVGCGAGAQPDASGAASEDPAMDNAGPTGSFDVPGGLTVTVRLPSTKVAAGEELIATLSYEYNGSSPLTIHDCEVGEVGIALVAPGEAVAPDQWLRPAIDCGGSQVLPPGSSGAAGTTSMLARAGGEPLEPGVYDAAFEFDGNTIRISVEVTPATPDPAE